MRYKTIKYQDYLQAMTKPEGKGIDRGTLANSSILFESAQEIIDYLGLVNPSEKIMRFIEGLKWCIPGDLLVDGRTQKSIEVVHYMDGFGKDLTKLFGGSGFSEKTWKLPIRLTVLGSGSIRITFSDGNGKNDDTLVLDYSSDLDCFFLDGPRGATTSAERWTTCHPHPSADHLEEHQYHALAIAKEIGGVVEFSEKDSVNYIRLNIGNGFGAEIMMKFDSEKEEWEMISYRAYLRQEEDKANQAWELILDNAKRSQDAEVNGMVNRGLSAAKAAIGLNEFNQTTEWQPVRIAGEGSRQGSVIIFPNGVEFTIDMRLSLNEMIRRTILGEQIFNAKMVEKEPQIPA